MPLLDAMKSFMHIGVSGHWGRAAVFVALLQGLSVAADPRPYDYASGADDFIETRQALLNRDWSGAMQTLQNLSERNPAMHDSAEFHNLMGFVWRQKGPQYLPRSIEHYHQSLRIEPSHVQAREYLGQAYLMMNRVDLARDQLQRIESLCMSRRCDPWLSLNRAIESHAPPR
jgi:tetratricopeptide (TPR) repeat protein